jgi:hypothetical protein
MLPENTFEPKSKKQLTSSDISFLLEEELSEFMRSRIDDKPLWYYDVTFKEYNQCLLKIVKAILNPKTVTAGEHRADNWEQGWSENFNELMTVLTSEKASTDTIVPKYFGKHEFTRLNKCFIKPITENFEYLALCIIVDWLFDKYLRDAQFIYEFGCGTGYHLFRLRNINKSAALYGLDWVSASQRIITSLVDKGFVSNLYGQHFDYYNPDYNFRLAKNSIVYTVASLEQIGTQHDKFINYLLDNRPAMCIHIEPISELLDENNLMDYLSIAYFTKRNYLSGFLSSLIELEKVGKIHIIKKQRTYIGSLFIEGHSVVVWTPC